MSHFWAVHGWDPYAKAQSSGTRPQAPSQAPGWGSCKPIPGRVNCSLDFVLIVVFKSLFVWSLTQDQFVMGGPTDKIASGIPGTYKLLYYDKIVIQEGGIKLYI